MYESTNVVLSDADVGGFCLTCRSQNDFNKTLLYSIDCTGNISCHCVKSDGRVSSSRPIMSTFDSYWKLCRKQNRYIVGDTSQTFCKRDKRIWTGLRKYKIDN